MILTPLLVASFVVSVAADSGMSWPPASNQGGALRHMSVQQKRAVIGPLVDSANECIARRVSVDPRFASADSAAMNELIVESVPSCLDAVRALIDAQDRLFGDGAGERFLMGPYLDALPDAVHRLIADQK